MVTARDKCRFGSYVHNFIVLKHGQHTSKHEYTLASKTHAWTCKQECNDASKANEWHKQV